MSPGGVASDLSTRILNNPLLDLFTQWPCSSPAQPPSRLKKQWRFTRVTLVIYPAETHVTILEFHRWEKFFLKSTRETCVLTLLPRQRGRRAGAVFSCVSVVLQRCRHTQLQPSRCSHSTCRMSRRQAKQIEQDRKSGLKTSGTF